MDKIRHYFKEEKLYWRNECAFSVLNSITDLFSVLFTIVTTFWGWEKFSEYLLLRIILVILASGMGFIKLYVLIRHRSDKRNYERIRKTEEVSVATLQAFKNANSAKSRCILQSTYGSTYKWHPTDYINNVLTYDVHEQIRNILLGLQSLIIASTNRLNEDQITVDFVYCYPGIEGCNGQLSADQKEHWRDKNRSYKQKREKRKIQPFT